MARRPLQPTYFPTCTVNQLMNESESPVKPHLQCAFEQQVYLTSVSTEGDINENNLVSHEENTVQILTWVIIDQVNLFENDFWFYLKVRCLGSTLFGLNTDGQWWHTDRVAI